MRRYLLRLVLPMFASSVAATSPTQTQLCEADMMPRWSPRCAGFSPNWVCVALYARRPDLGA